MSDNIKVVVKVRPLISREVEDKLSYRWRVKSNTLSQLDQNGRETDVCFTFDKVYDKETKTPEVYNDIAKPIVEAAIAGFNGTIFAYGQTSSGKTYTMTGNEESPGIIPLAVLNLFEMIKKKKDRDFLVRVSYIEIYNETLKDLLNMEKKNIKIHDTLQGGVKVDCSERVTGSPEEVLEAMKEGEGNRQTGATNMNEESSRSHSIFQITIESREHVDGDDGECGCVNVSQLNLVDLAGSERAGQTGATGLRFKEGTHINKSLSVLALVIKQLSEGPNKYANYRDSKLTRILQNSLGGNAKTSIICAITPATVEETISTLQFANRAKSIKNKPEVNAVATNATMIQSLTKQLCKLQAELAAKENLEVMHQELQNRIATLQKLILNGFGQRSSMELGQRKAAAPRRATISALPRAEPERAPPARFCTPSLKYNSLCMPSAPLAAVPEEARALTPPPTRKTVGFSDEVIEINSDDDSVTETRCSPYHKCYGSSNTPPCVLRKHARQAEKNLKDIVEFTEREKIYAPDVVELIEKLEQNKNVIVQLQEEIGALKESSKEKDSEIEQLAAKVRDTADVVNTITSAKAELEVQCKEKDTKLTDLEVCYETLFKKAKTREEELLSLLADHQKREGIGIPKKMESEMLNFMDMSKDISLVNSDNDSSTQDDGSAQLHDLVATMQAELGHKTQALIDLQANIFAHKQEIESLQTSSQQLALTIDALKNQLSNVESENSLLKCTIDNLNSTIESLKQNLESADKDIESYNNTIQELQIQLNKKENILNMKVDDATIDTMIANEQKCIANNDNIKNIIHSFKVILESRNKQIESLKTAIEENKEASADSVTLTEQIVEKENVISTLIEEAEKLKAQLNVNSTVLNNLMQAEQHRTDELTTLQEENKVLQKQNIENAIEIESLQGMTTESEIQIGKLKCDNENLTRKVTEHEINVHNISSKNQDLLEKIEGMTNKISGLEKILYEKEIENEKLISIIAEKEISGQKMCTKIEELIKQMEDMSKRVGDVEHHLEEKDKDVASAKDVENKTEKNFTTAKTILYRLQDIVLKLKGDTENLPESIEDLTKVLEITDTVVNYLDDSAKQSLVAFADLEDQFTILAREKESDISVFKFEYEQLNSELTVQTETLTQKTFALIEELKNTREELGNKDQAIIELEEKLGNAVSVNNDKDLQIKDNLHKASSVLHKLHYIALKLNHGIEELPDTIDNYDKLFESFETNLSVLDSSVILILKIAVDMQEKLMEFTNEKESEIANFESQIEKINSDMAIQTFKLSEQILHLIEQLKNSRAELETKNQELNNLEIELNDAQENNENLRKDLSSKDNSIEALNTKLASLNSVIENLTKINMNNDQLEEMLKAKNAQIQFLEDQLSNDADSLEDKYRDVTNALGEAIQNRDMLLAEILKKAARVARQCGIDSSEIGENEVENVYERVVLILDKIGMSVALLKTENDIERSDIEKMLTVAKEEIENLTETNGNLLNDYEELRNNHNELLLEIELYKKLNIEMLGNSEILEQLKLELHSKSNDIKTMKDQTMEWKEQFKSYEHCIKVQMRELVEENMKLKSMQKINLKRQSFFSDSSQNPNLRRSFSNVIDKRDNLQTNSPQSLSTICCNKIIKTIQLNSEVSASTSSMTTTISRSSVQFENAETQTHSCDCVRLSSELDKATEQNLKLLEDLDIATRENLEIIDLLKELQATNDNLLEEREEVRKEIKLLVEPAIELQKKITNHRTNLSTLTATTYAENKLLNSQLKVLKHHHARSIHVCQRDLPAFKTQLNELMTILKESSFTDKQNASSKRFSLPDVLDSSTTGSTFKNESTLDGDLLMLDTNLTNTTVNNTLVGPDQTFFDVTQVNFDVNETLCQTNDISKILDPCLLYSQIETVSNDNQKLSERIEKLQQENYNLKKELELSVKPATYKDAHSSPIKMNGVDSEISTSDIEKTVCEYCMEVKKELSNLEETLTAELRELSKELQEMKTEKDSIQEKYNNLTLEIPVTDALIRKLNTTEKDNMAKLQEIDKLSNALNKKNKTIKELQNENDTLSVQVMDNISEADSLKKELDKFKETNTELTEKIKHLEMLAKDYEIKINSDNTCSECAMKDDIIKRLQLEHSKLTRSFSDSESSSRHNKICTLQNELHASKEDCKKITEEVATIKNHLDRSNVSVCQAMDLDESMGESSIFVISNDLNTGEKHFQSIPNDQTLDVYSNDKMDCFNFYVDKFGPGKEFSDGDFKMIDIMKTFYNNIVAKHGDEVDNLLNKLKDFEEIKNRLQTQLNNVNTDYSKVTKELQVSHNNIKAVTNILDIIKGNINVINREMSSIMDVDKNFKLVTMFKENILKVFDSEFGLSCFNIFESLIDTIVNKHEQVLSDVTEKYTNLQNNMESVVTELNDVKENLKQIKCHLCDKENEYNLLKAQKEKIHEISNAVTLDIIKKEQELTEMLVKGYEKLVHLNLIVPYNTEASLPLNEKLKLLFEQIIPKKHNTSKIDSEKENLIAEINILRANLEEKENNMSTLREKLSESKKHLEIEKSLQEDLSKTYKNKVDENKTLVEKIEQLTKEMCLLKKEIKEKTVMDLDRKEEENVTENQAVKECMSCSELLTKVECWRQEHDNLKNINDMITREKATYASELEKAQEIIARNKDKIDNMTSNILVLRESIKDNVSIIQTLTIEAKSMMEQNVQLKKQFEDKRQDCSRLEINIKTHEKTAEIQSKMITRLQKQKEDDDKVAKEKNKQLEELQKQKEDDNRVAKEKDKQLEEMTEKCTVLQKECELIKDDLKTAREELTSLKNKKDSLEMKVTELEWDLVQDGHRRRPSIDGIAETSRRRRQSLHDNQRAFDEQLDEIEAVFGARAKPDDLFGGGSARARARDSTPDAAAAQARRRRQSTHDQHRPVPRDTPSPHDALRSFEQSYLKPSGNLSAGDTNATDVAQVREQLAATRQELEELKEQYKELDDECETCAEYLREREEQCRKLKKEKTALEKQITELNEKLKFNPNRSESKPSFADAAVNTDEDWANLHSVVVDRMSFDAEVEKNKKLNRTIEELRCNKQELKNMLAKMQRALERGAAAQGGELEAARADVEQLRAQCTRLRDAKHALEKKLDEVQVDVSNMAAAVRRKRHSVHDHNRGPHAHAADSGHDLLTHQVERDDNALKSSNAQVQELQRAKMALDKVLREKASLESQLAAHALPALNPTLYVATGSAIVQNQQITDVMKENQKLKKMNAKLITICKKRGKAHDRDRENEQPAAELA